MAYERGFAYVYNQRWTGFAKQVAPLILDYYEGTPLGGSNRSLLDLCCGTGQFAREALDRGYRTVGIDLSPHMLEHAEENNRAYIKSGQAHFLQGDARDFRLEERFGLVVATYDALNHLGTQNDVGRCFHSVLAVVACGGTFIFDLNTRKRLRQWTGINVTDEEELTLIERFMYLEDQNRAYASISGYIRREGGLYERFSETATNTAFDMAEVLDMLLKTGFKEVRMARVRDLSTPVTDPEAENRVFFVATK